MFVCVSVNGNCYEKTLFTFDSMAFSHSFSVVVFYSPKPEGRQSDCLWASELCAIRLIAVVRRINGKKINFLSTILIKIRKLNVITSRGRQ